MQCEYCSQEAINTEVTYYHNDNCPMTYSTVCGEHTTEDRKDTLGREHKTAYGILPIPGGTLRNYTELFWLEDCDGCGKSAFTIELIWTEDERYKYCPDCASKKL